MLSKVPSLPALVTWRLAAEQGVQAMAPRGSVSSYNALLAADACRRRAQYVKVVAEQRVALTPRAFDLFGGQLGLCGSA